MVNSIINSQGGGGIPYASIILSLSNLMIFIMMVFNPK